MGLEDFHLLEQPSENVPSIYYVGELSERVVRVLHGRTANRIPLGFVVVVGDKVIARGLTFFVDNNGHYKTFVWSIDELEDRKDPVSYMVASFYDLQQRRSGNVSLGQKQWDFGRSAYHLGEGGSSRGVSFPGVPQNAVLVSVDPPRWIQFGKCKILVTDGSLWLAEKVGECSNSWITVKRFGEKYYVVLKHVRLSMGMRIEGVFEFVPGDNRTGASMRDVLVDSKCDGKCLFRDMDRKVWVRENIVFCRDFRKFVDSQIELKNITEFIRLPWGRYVPRYFLKDVVG